MNPELMQGLISIAGIVLTGGGVAWYCKQLGNKIDKMSDIITDFPKEYTLKADCSMKHEQVDNNLCEHRKLIEQVSESISYFKGVQNGSRA
jgi:hypothetical protein